tara:strand:- start:21 stop:284 length:264 start_codon:yes stop_codon:yes gene_type:complete
MIIFKYVYISTYGAICNSKFPVERIAYELAAMSTVGVNSNAPPAEPLLSIDIPNPVEPVVSDGSLIRFKNPPNDPVIVVELGKVLTT